jgi:hypothetical protein
MTLKEKVAEVKPNEIGDFYGGVCGCPHDYEFLNITKDESRTQCKCDNVFCGGKEACEECWNREFIYSGNPQEVPSTDLTTESKLHQISAHIDSKSYLSVEYGNGKWYVECWTDGKLRMLHNDYTDNLEETLNEIIKKLEGK